MVQWLGYRPNGPLFESRQVKDISPLQKDQTTLSAHTFPTEWVKKLLARKGGELSSRSMKLTVPFYQGQK
jgi:hypothetical protein